MCLANYGRAEQWESGSCIVTYAGHTITVTAKPGGDGRMADYEDVHDIILWPEIQNIGSLSLLFAKSDH